MSSKKGAGSSSYMQKISDQVYYFFIYYSATNTTPAQPLCAAKLIL